MSIQLTQEQEQRLQAVVTGGAYPSIEAAPNAALSVIERTASYGFEGSEGELNALLLEGLDAGEPTDAIDVWQRVTAQTDQMLAEHETRFPRSRTGA